MFRWLQLIVTAAILVESGSICAQAKSALPSEDRWNPQHISGLPAEIRSAIAPFARACGDGGRLSIRSQAISNAGPRSSSAFTFEHLSCPNRAAVCSAAGCLHQVYISTGGRYRLLSSSHVPRKGTGNFWRHNREFFSKNREFSRRSRELDFGTNFLTLTRVTTRAPTRWHPAAKQRAANCAAAFRLLGRRGWRGAVPCGMKISASRSAPCLHASPSSAASVGATGS